jgi:hypothetical protein
MIYPATITKIIIVTIKMIIDSIENSTPLVDSTDIPIVTPITDV